MARNYHLAKFSDKPTGKLRLCGRLRDSVALYQRGKDRFAVQYGMQVDDDLTYNEACAALGAAIMHAMACDGDVDNRERGER